MMPNGTAQIAMSMTSPAVPPRATHRFSPIQMAAATPRMMHSAYPRSGTGPTCQTPSDGLGIDSGTARSEPRAAFSMAPIMAGQEAGRLSRVAMSTARSWGDVSRIHSIGTVSSASTALTWSLWVTS